MIKKLKFRAVWLSLNQKSLDECGPGGSSSSFTNQRSSRSIFASKSLRFILVFSFFLGCLGNLNATELRLSDSNPLEMPVVGSYGLRILSPTLLELTLVNTKDPDPARVSQWDFVGDNSQPNLPSPQEFIVSVAGQSVGIQKVGFKRRVLYAPVKKRDLRIGNYLYLELSGSIGDGQVVEVKNPNGRLWANDLSFSATADPMRWSPAIHVNQVGYVPSFSKKAMVGFYLGTLGEMKVPAQAGFRLVDVATGAVVHQGTLTPRLDNGFTYDPKPYQQVLEADFTAFRTPGEYRLVVPGLGASLPFFVNEGSAAVFARAFALGLYHQRCGCASESPWTRFVHGDCHVAPADVPTMEFHKTQEVLAEVSSDYKKEVRHTAPQLKDVNSSLYPFVTQGKIDVSGGHHDAGDYSKYTINSAGLIHHLVFAADAFAGAGALDNLGIPESGDGKSDLLQEAKWEADFLAKMQDADGGFYFLVYPRERRYEDDVLPDRGDPQVVWPKTTAVTAAAVAALAEAGSSPLFRQQFPKEAELYLEKAKLGWNFLEKAIAAHGKDGAYQRITHYGNEFMHDDELAWAAAAMFAATGEPVYHEKLKAWFNPANSNTRRWTWWRLFEGYGCAVRTYAFAARTGRRTPAELDASYLAKCEAEIKAAAQDQLRFARDTAYGTSFPDPNKQNRNAGWFFSSERAFDLTVAYQIDPKPEFLDAIISNLNYEGGCNPVNVAYVTGIGWKRQRDIVHQYAQNDRRVLPPSGIPLGNIQAGFMGTLYHYKQELSGLSFPSDWASRGPYPLYDRWGDSFNVSAEFVVVDQARSLGSLAFVMALTEVKDQRWNSATGQITGLPAQVAVGENVTATFVAAGLDLSQARILWEARDQEPFIGQVFRFNPKNPGEQWIEAEAQLPDGRRIVAATTFSASFSSSIAPNSYQSSSLTGSAETVALFHFDTDEADATGRHGNFALTGRAARDTSNVGWMANRSGAALSIRDCGDYAKITLPANALYPSPDTSAISLEAMIYVNEYKSYNRGNARLLSLYANWNASLEFIEDAYSGPQFKGGTQLGIFNTVFGAAFPTKQWHHVCLKLDRNGYTLVINGNVIATQPSAELSNWSSAGSATLEIGNFDGWVDEVVVKSASQPLSSNPAVIAKPVISPNGGIFSKPVPISLKTTTPGAAIRYTTNGSAPTVSSKLYDLPFTLSTSAVVKAKAFIPGIDESPVASAIVTINSTVPSQSSATFVKIDSTTKGNWIANYGSDGYVVVGQPAAYPAFGQVVPSGQSEYSWTDSTIDPRALQKVSGNGRLAACWYSGTGFTVDLNLTDGKAHRVGLYCVDWDRVGRVEVIELFDPNGVLLDRQTVSDFSEGKHLLWDVQGRVRFQFSKGSGSNAVLMGLFFDPSPAKAAPQPASGKGSVSSVHRLLNGDCRLHISGEAGTTVVIEASTNLVAWTPIGTLVLSGQEADFIDTEAHAFPGRFYRVAPQG